MTKYRLLIVLFISPICLLPNGFLIYSCSYVHCVYNFSTVMASGSCQSMKDFTTTHLHENNICSFTKPEFLQNQYLLFTISFFSSSSFPLLLLFHGSTFFLPPPFLWGVQCICLLLSFLSPLSPKAGKTFPKTISDSTSIKAHHTCFFLVSALP